jgi:hypothetical protein
MRICNDFIDYVMVFILVSVILTISIYIFKQINLNIGNCQDDMVELNVSCDVNGGWHAYDFNESMAKMYHSCCFTEAIS